ncbi:DUF4142 domain-containing protein [Flavobacterium sp. NRK F7]|nr:DUF4142 domain-containing protein [Flavobacterium sp. NRK F7]MCO6163636.1 DUF4142 domain-containing protein [Flavobacterium sp. NRK F7]
MLTKTSNNTNNYKNVEAELLAKFNEKNLNLITISNHVKEKEVPFRVKCLATELIKEQSKINKVISKITSEKLIIVPNLNVEQSINRLERTKKDNFNSVYLETVSKILSNQIQDLTELSKTTNDIDFKILALQTIVKLNTSLDKVNQIKIAET